MNALIGRADLNAEGSAVIEVVRRWAARLGTVQLTGDQANPVISVRLEGVDIERVLKNAEVADTPGGPPSADTVAPVRSA